MARLTKREQAARAELRALGFTNAQIKAARTMAESIDPTPPSLSDIIAAQIEAVRPMLPHLFERSDKVAKRIARK